MLERYLKMGDKIEISTPWEIDSPIYISQVEEIYNQESIRIAAPIAGGKIIPLHIGQKYVFTIYGEKSLYECKAKIVKRKSIGELHFMEAEITSKLEKVQRREFFRFECLLPF